jgi:hypothetical protein
MAEKADVSFNAEQRILGAVWNQANSVALGTTDRFVVFMEMQVSRIQEFLGREMLH